MNNNIHVKIKFLIITMAILILSALILLTILLIKKKKARQYSEISHISSGLGQTINLSEIGISQSCNPVEIIFKENYIAIYSKKCNIIKILKIR